MAFTHRNPREDLEDVGSKFDGPPGLEFRMATQALGLEESGLTYQRVPPDYRFPYGHTHRTLGRGAGGPRVDPRGDVEGARDWWPG